MRTRRELGVELVDLVLDGVDHADAVGVREFDDDQRDAFLAVDANDAGASLEGVLNGGNIAEIHRPRRSLGDHDVAKRFDSTRKRVEVHAQVGRALGDRAGRYLELLRLERVDDAVDRQIAGAQCVLIDRDVDLVGDARTNRRGADAGQRIELLLERVFGEVLQMRQLRSGEHHGRHALGVEVDLAD